MKILYFSFLAIVLLGSLSIDEAFSQQSTDNEQNQTADWSQLFPEIPGCEREIQPIKQNGEVWEQTAIYERENYKNNGSENYFGCGSITLRFQSSARKSARHRSPFDDPTSNQPIRIKNFEAYRNSPLCGNDFWIGSTTIYFDKDKLLTVSAYLGAEKILDYAQRADYELMKKSMNKLIKHKTRREMGSVQSNSLNN